MQPTGMPYRHPFLSELPLSLKVLYTNVLITLALGYIFGLVQIYGSHALADGKPGMSVADVQIAYRGDRGQTRLEAAIHGPMSDNLEPAEAERIAKWIHAGVREEAYNDNIKAIFDARCIACHNPENASLPDLTTYAKIKEMAQIDTGPSVSTLVRVSHIHMFGLTFVFAILGMIFSHAHFQHRKIKSIIITIPFLAIFVDIASWWLARLSEIFGYTVVIGGAFMGVAFAIQWTLSMYQMWFYRVQPDKLDAPG